MSLSPACWRCWEGVRVEYRGFLRWVIHLKVQKTYFFANFFQVFSNFFQVFPSFFMFFPTVFKFCPTFFNFFQLFPCFFLATYYEYFWLLSKLQLTFSNYYSSLSSSLKIIYQCSKKLVSKLITFFLQPF